MLDQKRAGSIDGALVSLSLPTVDLSQPFSSHVEVAFRGVAHRVITYASPANFDFTNTTGEFSVNTLQGFIAESVDTVSIRATHRFSGVVLSQTGCLVVHTYTGRTGLLDLIAALNPAPRKLGMMIKPTAQCTLTSEPKVALGTQFGILEICPLTTQVVDQLPEWRGTSVAAGEMFAGSQSDGAPYMAVISETARVVALPAADLDIDQVASSLASLRVRWHS